jgi:hypothetical protein
MPCLLALLAFFFPRVVLVVLWLTTGYLSQAYQTVIWPLLGFFFLPYTTLAYAWAVHSGGGTVSGFPLVVVIIAVLVDLGAIGGGAKARRRTVVVRE